MRLDLETGFWALLALGAGPWLFWRGFRHLRLKRLMENTPTARIRSMAMGLVEINGKVETRSAVTAPFSGRACAYWEVDVSTRSGKRGWQVVHRNRSGHPFYLRDTTGVALIYPHGANCRLNFGVSEECLGLTLPSCYSDYFDHEGLGASVLWRMGAMRFRERVLEPGQPIYVLGTAMPRSQVSVVSDGEGMRATGTESLRSERLQTVDHEVVATVRQGDHEPTFIISEQSERTLTAFTGIQAFAELIGGPLITLVGLVYWIDHLAKGHLLFR
jgi:hypothetical protein